MFSLLKCKKPWTRYVFRSRKAWMNVWLTYLKVWEQEQKYGASFWSPNHSMKYKRDALNDINKEVRCAWCIYRLNCIKIDAVDVFTS